MDGDSCAITSPANDVRYLYGSVSMIAGQRCAYRWSRPSVRGAFVIGVHGSLHHVRSSLCTSVRASCAVFSVTTELPCFQEGYASSQSLGTLRSTWHAAVKLRYVSIGISLSQYICVCTPVQSSSHRMQITEQVFEGGVSMSRQSRRCPMRKAVLRNRRTFICVDKVARVALMSCDHFLVASFV